MRRIGAALALMGSMALATAEERTMDTGATDRCRQALTALRGLDLTGWAGLPEACGLADVVSALGVPQEAVGRGLLGSEKAAHALRLVRVEGHDEPVRLWFDGDALLAVDVEYPEPTGGLAAWERTLGKPSLVLDFVWGHLPVREGERVWPDRGVAVFVNAANGALLRAFFFRPTTADVYTRRLRLDLETRRLPDGP